MRAMWFRGTENSRAVECVELYSKERTMCEMVYDRYQFSALLWFLICFDEISIQDEQVCLRENHQPFGVYGRMGRAWQLMSDCKSSTLICLPAAFLNPSINRRLDCTDFRTSALDTRSFWTLKGMARVQPENSQSGRVEKSWILIN